MSELPPIRKRTRQANLSRTAGPVPAAGEGGPPADTESSYQVGYKKPPLDTRFKKGQSGNPNGRPRGTKNLKTDLLEELQELIRIKEGGTPRTITKQRAMVKNLTAKAVNGDPRAVNLLINLVLRLVQVDAEEVEDADLNQDDQEIMENLAKRHRRDRNHDEE